MFRPGVILVVLMLLNLVSAVAVVQAKHQSRGLQNELQQLRLVKDNIESEWAQLQLEESAWANHGRVDQLAREKLGMVEPVGYQVVAVQK